MGTTIYNAATIAPAFGLQNIRTHTSPNGQELESVAWLATDGHRYVAAPYYDDRTLSGGWRIRQDGIRVADVAEYDLLRIVANGLNP